MNQSFQQLFIEKWNQYFPGAELPFAFFYSDDAKYEEDLRRVEGFTCMIGQLKAVRNGKTLSFSQETFGCFGGLRYAGYPMEDNPNFKFFLSYGIPGQLEGERYKKTPELVEQYVKDMPVPPAPGKYLVFKRWDRLDKEDEPLVAVFFARPDVISGLFTLANFPSLDPQAAIAPFCSGCGSIMSYPLAECDKEEPRAVLGMFDVSARPFVKENILSFAVPLKKLKQMFVDMDESFLITGSWGKVARRIERGGE